MKNNIANQIALWADKLKGISGFGLRKTKDSYDKDRYTSIQDICLEMFSCATNQNIDELEPLRDNVLTKSSPHSVGGTAIINENDEILLIKRASNGKWAMPSGNLEIGESPVEGAIREAYEETGVRVKPMSLVGIYDSLKNNVPTVNHLYFILFLCKPLDNQSIKKDIETPNEVLDAKWYKEQSLPESISPGNEKQIHHAFQIYRGEQQSFFDI
jgi:ADP-ribose pyrophosphatase YjhB (NUDIX family)